ncbi:unnamed protein product [Parnassius apollo]|uniref:(apollo) hypothetical protein n=1 Tax=Parnassius apollo TaxID=110799 RepID=A0A8S3XCF3_PARAO|nr:unnamed protein product [Parnassius apollo]
MMAWLYSCAIWILLIHITAYCIEAARTGHHPFRRTRAAPRNELTANEHNGGILFPGLTSRSGASFKPKIPKDCENVGICDNIPDYPKNYVSLLLNQMTNTSFTKFNVDVIEPQIAQRITPGEENLELCRSSEKLYNPEAAKDINEQWHYIVNKVLDVQQTFRVEICERQNEPCNSVVHFAQGNEASCKQKFILRKMVALDYDGKLVEKPFLIPSCCSCIYRVIEV